MSFAKLYGPDNDQVLVTIDVGAADNRPEVRVHFQPEGLGVCSTALQFPDTDDGWNKADAAFAAMDEEKARKMIKVHLSRLGMEDVYGR